MLRKRKLQYFFCILGICLAVTACQKDWNDVDPNGKLNIADGFQISLDTVLGNTGSSVYRFNFTNPGSKAILFSTVYLKQGDDSPFLLNMDGQSGSALQNIRVLGKDSVYLFIQTKKDTMVHRGYIRDTLIFVNNSTVQKIPIRAYLEQVIQIKDRWIWTHSTSFTDNASYLIEKGLEIPEGETVNIPAGVHFYFRQNDSTCVIRGTINALGTVDRPIVFSSNRTDEYYHTRTGLWAGLQFESTSANHLLRHVHIRNANTACTINSSDFKAESCIFSYSTCAIQATSANVILSNCLLFGHLMKTLNISAGNLRMTHCALFGDRNRGGALMQVQTSIDSAGQALNKPTHLLVCNSIIYGSLDNEMLFQTNQQNLLNVLFRNNIIRVDDTYRQLYISFWPLESNWNIDPMFTNPEKENFRLTSASPGLNKSISAIQAGYQDPAFEIDLLDVIRNLPSHLGPYSTP